MKRRGLVAADAPSSQKQPIDATEAGKKRLYCHFCKVVGHRDRQCEQKRARLVKKREEVAKQVAKPHAGKKESYKTL